MKIFVTGSTGFIGQHICNKYKKHNIFAFNRNMNLHAEMNKFNPDLIFNCAAEIYDASKMWDVNVELTKSCVDYVINSNKTSMIHFGSSSEYGDMDRPTKETDPINPNSIYGATKGIASMLCQSFAKEYEKDIVVIRPYSIFGIGEKPHRLFPSLYRSFYKQEQIKVVDGVHDFCYIEDFIEAVDCITQSKERNPGEIINIGNGVQYTNAEVCLIFEKISGNPGNITKLDQFTTPKFWQADISHIQSKYKWEPKFDLASAVKDFCDKVNYE